MFDESSDIPSQRFPARVYPQSYTSIWLLAIRATVTAMAIMWAGRSRRPTIRPLGIVLSNKPVKDFQAIPHQAKAVNAGDWRVKDYILCRPDCLFNRRRSKRAIFDHVCIARAVNSLRPHAAAEAFSPILTA